MVGFEFVLRRCPTMITISEIVAICSVIVASLAFLFNYSKAHKGEILDSQAIRDKLDYISDTTRDTREDVRALDRKLDDHASRISKIEARVDSYEKRIERLEDKQQ